MDMPEQIIKQSRQRMDEANASMSKSAGLKRIKSKSNSAVYNNAQWDLVDAKDNDGDWSVR